MLCAKIEGSIFRNTDTHEQTRLLGLIGTRVWIMVTLFFIHIGNIPDLFLKKILDSNLNFICYHPIGDERLQRQITLSSWIVLSALGSTKRQTDKFADEHHKIDFSPRADQEYKYFV